MKYEEFITKFSKQVFSINNNKRLTLAIEVCKKLYFDYAEFSDKYQWGDKDVLLDAIKILEQSKTQEVNDDLLEHTLKKIDLVTPDMDDFGSEELSSYALNSCVAVYSSLEFLVDKLPKHIYDVGICLTDTIDFKIQENKDLTEEEIDKNPLMVEARNYLVDRSK
jgi:uncharacterized protein YjaG (DUF416 family)